MKSHFLALAFVAAAALAPFAARADDEVSFETFYDNLAPYGEWIQVGDYGDCWHPSGVDADWAPYTDGYWSYTDAGWTWVSYEDFGDITYHYGRWVNVDDVGWCWVPDSDWGPAWVSWRSDDEYVGWAPLPPEARWRQNVGFSTWCDDSYDIGPQYYNFCPVVEFGAPVIRHVCVPRVRVVGIFGHTANITNICWSGYSNQVFCGGPNYAFINTRLYRPIPALKLVHNTTVINNNVTIINNRRVVKFPRGAVAGNTLNVFAPKVVRKDFTNINRPQIARVIQKEKVNRGWKLQNQGEVAKLRAQVKKETKGLTPDTSPAKPVQVADLKPIPEKADPKGPSPVAGRGDGRGKGPNGNDNKPDRAVADRPGRGNGNDDRPDRPGKADGNQPDRGAVAADEPDRQGGDQGKQKKIAGDKQDKDNADRAGHGGAGNPVVRPFNDPSRDNRPDTGMAKKQGGDDNDGAAQAERQRKAAAEQSAERQRRAAEMYSERQRAAAEARKQQRQAALRGNDGGGEERAERPQQPQQQQRDQGERQQQQQQYQRQQLQQRQAQEQQRQNQAQRQQQIQRQLQQAQQQQQQGGGGGQGKQPAQGQGQGQGGGKGRQLTPEEKAAQQKQRGF